MFGGGAEGRGWGGEWGRRGSLKWKVGGRKTGGSTVGVDSGRPSRATTDVGDRQLSPFFFFFFAGASLPTLPSVPPPTFWRRRISPPRRPLGHPCRIPHHLLRPRPCTGTTRGPRVPQAHRPRAKGRAGHPLGSRVSESFGCGRDFRFGPPVCHDHHHPRAWGSPPPHPSNTFGRGEYVSRRSTGSARGRVPPICRPIATQPMLSTTHRHRPPLPPLLCPHRWRGGEGRARGQGRRGEGALARGRGQPTAPRQLERGLSRRLRLYCTAQYIHSVLYAQLPGHCRCYPATAVTAAVTAAATITVKAVFLPLQTPPSPVRPPFRACRFVGVSSARAASPRPPLPARAATVRPGTRRRDRPPVCLPALGSL